MNDSRVPRDTGVAPIVTNDSLLSQITPLVLTLNEAANLRRTLAELGWARKVVVLDSFSADETEAIACSFANVVFVQRHFDNHATQWNFGLELVDTEWVLSLDADYRMSDELRVEISRLDRDSGISGYFVRFHYCVAGHPLRGCLYPPRAVLFRKSECRYVQDGHTQILAINGPIAFLHAYLLHDDRKPLSCWLEAQRRYSRLEAQKLIEHPRRPRSMADCLRTWIWPAAPAAFLYTLLVKRCLLDGWPGWYYVLQRTYFEMLLSLELLDRRLCGSDTPVTALKGDSDRND